MNRKIIAAVDDMIFSSKIRATAEPLAVALKFVSSVEQLMLTAAEQKPDLIVVDLHNQKIDSVALAKRLKSSDELKAVTLLGFFSHVETEAKRAALEAGFDKVIPRSVFTRDLASILQGEVRERLSSNSEATEE